MILLDRAIRYAENVLSGKEITTWEVEAQCEIFLDDYYENQFEEDFEFIFDEKRLLRINNILKLMNFATGHVEGKEVLENLADFQCFFLANIFGWRYKNNRKKFRYREATLYIARKNAKTALIAIVFILLMLTEQQFSEFYSICLTKELASEIKKAMSQIINASPLLKKRFKISQTKTGVIKCKLTESFFEPRVAEAGKNNSIRPSAFVSDEHANFKENSNFNAMKSGQRNVINPLLFRTTTAYAIDNSIMLEDLEYIRKVLKGSVKDRRMFALIYYAYEENLWNDIGLYQANPLRIEENYQLIREDREKARIKEDEQEEYLTKSMNHFVPENCGEEYVTEDQIKACEVEDIDWTGRDVYLGLDVAETDDNTALAMLAYDSDNDEILSEVFAIIPQDKIEIKSFKEKVDYKAFIKKGNCYGCGDTVISYEFIIDLILEVEEKFNCNVIQFGYDIRNARAIAQRLDKEGMTTVEVKQHSSILHSPIKLIKEYILRKKFKYKENDLLKINFVNCRETKDTNLNKYLNKKKSIGKIDMVMSIIDAAYLLQENEMLAEDDWAVQTT